MTFAGSNDLYAELCDAIERPDLKLDDRFSTNSLRVKHRKLLIEKISAVIQSKTNDEWMNVFKSCRFPYGPVNNIENVFKDPQVCSSFLRRHT